MRAVNLLPADAYVAKPKLPYAPVVLAATVPVLAAALVYLGYSLEHAKLADKRVALDVVQGQIRAHSRSAALVAAAARVVDEKTKRQLELSDALAKQVPWDRTFDQVARVLPANAWLSGMTVESPTPASTTSASAVSCTITGYTYTQADVALVLSRLALVPSFTNVQLSSATVSSIGTKNVVQFSITAGVTGSTA